MTSDRKRTRNSYSAMLHRCYDPRHQAYRWYGARGITVWERWQGPEGFGRFVEDMGLRPEGCSLDRLDPDGHYEPGNCRWYPARLQQANCRRSRYVTYRGRRVLLRHLIEARGAVRRTAVMDRLARGWSLEDALHTPPRRMPVAMMVNG